MDGSQFDLVVKSFAASGSRRRVLGGLVGGALAIAGLGGADASICHGDGRICREHANCCSGLCGRKNRQGRRTCAARYDIFVSAFAGQDAIGLPTGIFLAPGQQARITAVDANATCDAVNGGCEFGPNGANPSPAAFVPTLAAYALIGRVGAGPWVFVGAGPTTLTGTGQLYLAYNDGKYGDNAGGFQATVYVV